MGNLHRQDEIEEPIELGGGFLGAGSGPQRMDRERPGRRLGHGRPQMHGREHDVAVVGPELFVPVAGVAGARELRDPRRDRCPAPTRAGATEDDADAEVA